MTDKERELQECLNNPELVQLKNVCEEHGIDCKVLRNRLSKANIKCYKYIRLGRNGRYAFWNKQEVLSVLNDYDKEIEFQECLDNPELVQLKDVAKKYGISYGALKERTIKANIKACRHINFARNGRYAFYHKQEVLGVLGNNYNSDKQRELQECLNNPELVQLKDIAEEWGIKHGTISTRIRRANIKCCNYIRLGKNGAYVFYNKSEVLSVLNDDDKLDKQQKLQECLNNPELVQLKDMAEECGINRKTLVSRIGKAKIKRCKHISFGPKGRYCFYRKQEVLSVLNDDDKLDKHQLLQECLNNPELVQLKDICKEYGVSRVALESRICRAKIKCCKYISFGRNGRYAFYHKQEVLGVLNDNEKQRELQECLNNPELAQLKDMAKECGVTCSALGKRLSNAKIKCCKRLIFGNKDQFFFYNKSEVLSVLQDKIADKQQQERKEENLPTMINQPDIIPADTLDIYTLKQIQDRLEADGVSFNQDIYNYIASSDNEVYRQIQDMIEGKSRDIVLHGSKVREIVEELRGIGDCDGEAIDEIKKVFAKHASTNSKECKRVLLKFGYLIPSQVGKILGMSYSEIKTLENHSFPACHQIMLGRTSLCTNAKFYVSIWAKSRVEKYKEKMETMKNEQSEKCKLSTKDNKLMIKQENKKNKSQYHAEDPELVDLKGFYKNDNDSLVSYDLIDQRLEAIEKNQAEIKEMLSKMAEGHSLNSSDSIKTLQERTLDEFILKKLKKDCSGFIEANALSYSYFKYADDRSVPSYGYSKFIAKMIDRGARLMVKDNLIYFEEFSFKN